MRRDPTNLTSPREGIPKDSERVDVDASETDAWYNILSEKLMGVSRRFVFNVEETGCSERIDSHEVTIAVPTDYPDPSVPVPVNCHTKRSTLKACIAVDGYEMEPFVILDRATVDPGVGLSGYDSSNVFLPSLENAFMTNVYSSHGRSKCSSRRWRNDGLGSGTKGTAALGGWPGLPSH
jgi:hypothetical protein